MQTIGAEYDPMDNPIGLAAPEPDTSVEGVSDIISPKFADALNLDLGCTIDGAAASCDLANSVSGLLSERNSAAETASRERARNGHHGATGSSGHTTTAKARGVPIGAAGSPAEETASDSPAAGSPINPSPHSEDDSSELLSVDFENAIVTVKINFITSGMDASEANLEDRLTVEEYGSVLAGFVKNMPEDIRQKLIDYNYTVQSNELIFCQAAIETGGVGWRVDEGNGNTRGFGDTSTSDLGLMQIQLGSANDSLKTHPKKDVMVKAMTDRKVKKYKWKEVRDHEFLNIALATWYLQNLINAAPYDGKEAVRFGLASYNGGRKNMLDSGYDGNPRATYYADSVLECESILQEQ